MEWNARETYGYNFTPAQNSWNGTTWKAFVKYRTNSNIYSCCIDTDWGVGIISSSKNIGLSIKNDNPYFEFKKFDENRKYYLNLISFDKLKKLFD